MSITPNGTEDLPLTASGRIDGRSARKIETRRRIIRAASDLFAESGYNGASMDDIAEAAGVSKGTIFYNFTNKAELYEQLIRYSVLSIAQDMTEAREGLTGWEAMKATMGRVLEVVDQNPSSAQIVLNELFRRQREWAESLADSRRILVTPLIEIFEELSNEREQRNGQRSVRRSEAQSVAMAMMGALVAAALDHRAFESDRDLQDLLGVLITAIQGMNPALVWVPAAEASVTRPSA